MQPCYRPLMTSLHMVTYLGRVQKAIRHVICMEDKSSFGIRGKIAFIRHRCYLLENHIWRRSKQHDGKVEHRPSLVALNRDDILQQLDSLNFPVMSKHPLNQDKKRKQGLNWTKRSIFFELPY